MRIGGRRGRDHEEKAAARAIRSFQSETASIRELRPPWQAHASVSILAAMIVTVIALVVVMPMDRVVTSSMGQIVSLSPNVVLQPLDLSIIKTIGVQEGDWVKQGQLIASLDSTIAAADVLALEAQVESLDAAIARCEAELDGKPYTFVAAERRGGVDYAALQHSLYERRKDQVDSQVAAFDAQIALARATVTKLSNDLARTRERRDIAAKVERMWVDLEAKDSGSQLQKLTAQDSTLQLNKAVENDRDAIVESERQIDATTENRKAFIEQWKVQTSQELVADRTQRDNLSEQLAKALKHKDLIRLEAPDDAIVLRMEKRSVGSVLSPGETFAELALLNSPVEAEILIQPIDIGFVRSGDHAVIKLDPYNYVEHGWVEGTVRWISQGTFTSAPLGTGGATAGAGTSAMGATPLGQEVQGGGGSPYYKARIAIDKVKLVNVPPDYRLLPGTTLTADIHIGTRSAFTYLVSGLLRGFNEAMREP